MMLAALVPVAFMACRKEDAGNGKAVVITAEVTDVTGNSAKSGGKITSDGGTPVTVRGVCYGTSEAPNISGTHTEDGSGSGEFVSLLTDLVPGSTYFVRAYASNKNGISYGNEVQFSVGAVVPSVTTASVSDIDNGSAVSGGRLGFNGGSDITEFGVCWGTAENPTVEGAHIAASAADSEGNYRVSITDLSAGETYYVRAYATNAVGTGYGEQFSFTPADDPVVSIPDAALKTLLVEKYDADGDGEITRSEALAAKGSLDLSDKGISSLSGIENFDALTEIIANKNSLVSVSLSGMKNLVTFKCCENLTLESLDMSGCPSLVTLEAYSNNLPTINLKGCAALVNLHIFKNRIEEIDLSDCVSLEYFNVSENRLKSLDVRNNRKLICLWANSGQYSEVNVGGFTTLKTLDVANGAVEKLDITGCTALELVYAGQNKIRVFDLKNLTALKEFYGYDQKEVIEKVEYSGCSSLEVIHFGNCDLKFSEWEFSDFQRLKFICIWGDEVTSLRLNNLPALETLNIDVNPLITDLDLSGCPSLVTLQMCVTGVQKLDLTKNPKIAFCQFFASPSVTELKLSGNAELSKLYAQDTQLSALDLSGCRMDMEEVNILNCPLASVTMKTGQKVDIFTKNEGVAVNYI